MEDSDQLYFACFLLCEMRELEKVPFQLHYDDAVQILRISSRWQKPLFTTGHLKDIGAYFLELTSRGIEKNERERKGERERNIDEREH
uniref:Uncharacterized protein n=1 Tax=Molossus molossus TaxID=27622 RepID=A0A7J8CZH8_MOLMO|nr:hypothetical protein HJG59_009520 [Molossus molossus]